jgi:hypothetical protein
MLITVEIGGCLVDAKKEQAGYNELVVVRRGCKRERSQLT